MQKGCVCLIQIQNLQYYVLSRSISLKHSQECRMSLQPQRRIFTSPHLLSALIEFIPENAHALRHDRDSVIVDQKWKEKNTCVLRDSFTKRNRKALMAPGNGVNNFCIFDPCPQTRVIYNGQLYHIILDTHWLRDVRYARRTKPCFSSGKKWRTTTNDSWRDIWAPVVGDCVPNLNVQEHVRHQT